MERKCTCGNFFDVRECSGICPECKADIFSQSTQGNNVSKKPNNLNMKYRLINLETKEEHLCDKVTINGYDYYALKTDISINDYITDGHKVIKWVDNQSLLGRGKVIATNNPNIDISKVVDEVEELALKHFHCVDKEQIEILDLSRKFELFIEGYNKSQETHPFSEEDVCDFVEWFNKNNLRKELPDMPIKEILSFWKEQKPKKLYFK